MRINFYKYQGAGNDFIMIDDRAKSFPVSTEFINHLCDRRFGIGADGLILLQNHPGYDFEMVYFNADGNISSMCGNGGRCIAAFAKDLGLIKDECSFTAIDGPHKAYFSNGQVSLQMKNVEKVELRPGAFVLDTGSPHYVQFMDHIDKLDVVAQAKKIRYNDEFAAKGINVNFVEKDSQNPDHISLRTYERGVEDETFACGTGVVASAIAYYQQSANDKSHTGHHKIKVSPVGGNLEVDFDYSQTGKYTNVWLTGPAEKVFSGGIEG